MYDKDKWLYMAERNMRIAGVCKNVTGGSIE